MFSAVNIATHALFTTAAVYLKSSCIYRTYTRDIHTQRDTLDIHLQLHSFTTMSYSTLLSTSSIDISQFLNGLPSPQGPPPFEEFDSKVALYPEWLTPFALANSAECMATVEAITPMSPHEPVRQKKKRGPQVKRIPGTPPAKAGRKNGVSGDIIN